MMGWRSLTTERETRKFASRPRSAQRSRSLCRPVIPLSPSAATVLLRLSSRAWAQPIGVAHDHSSTGNARLLPESCTPASRRRFKTIPGRGMNRPGFVEGSNVERLEPWRITRRPRGTRPRCVSALFACFRPRRRPPFRNHAKRLGFLRGAACDNREQFRLMSSSPKGLGEDQGLPNRLKRDRGEL